VPYEKIQINFFLKSTNEPQTKTLHFNIKYDEILNQVIPRSKVTLLHPNKTAVNKSLYSYYITPSLLSDLEFAINLEVKVCIAANTIEVFTLSPKKTSEVYYSPYELVKTTDQIALEEFCPEYLNSTSKILLSSLSEIQNAADAPITMCNSMTSLFASINLNALSASEILIISKFMNVSFPNNVQTMFFNGLNDSEWKKTLYEIIKLPENDNNSTQRKFSRFGKFGYHIYF